MNGNYFFVKKYFYQHLILLNKNEIFQLRAKTFLDSKRDSLVMSDL